MKIKTHIRRILTEKLKEPGDEVQFDLRIGGQIKRKRHWQITTAQLRAELLFETEARTIDNVIIVRRTDFDGDVLPGTARECGPSDVLRALLPWPDDPMYDAKTEIIHRCIDLFDN